MGTQELRVTVDGEEVETSHMVSVPESFDHEWGLSEVDGEALVNKSFELLLERERPTSILRELRLSTISEYFPPHLGGLRRRRS
ncbi:MAG: hypothetical protein KY447_02810 [Actinobacteria bacterium]|nr:hypothetical protein [Actinomycetota bacterium]MBW3641825.1 hypothetical protein [Actinomycetota bacterium]